MIKNGWTCVLWRIQDTRAQIVVSTPQGEGQNDTCHHEGNERDDFLAMPGAMSSQEIRVGGSIQPHEVHDA